MCRKPIGLSLLLSELENSVYYIVDASGDLDEDGEDSKISCTKMRLLKKIELRSLLLHGAAYMAKYQNRKWNYHVAKENGTSCNGFCIVRGKGPKAKGQKGDLLLLLKEQPGNSQILEIGVICIDGQNYPEEAWIDVTGFMVRIGRRTLIDKKKFQKWIDRQS